MNRTQFGKAPVIERSLTPGGVCHGNAADI